jgi:hypothetical protein
LDYLSADAFREITVFLSTQEILNLWLCGSTLLNWKLGEGGGIRTLSVGHDNTVPLAWLPLVHRIAQLREINITDSFGNAINPFNSKQLAELPPCIRSISLSFDNDLEAFTDALRLAPKRFENLERLELSCSSAKGRTQRTEWTLPPRLTNLMLWLPWMQHGQESTEMRIDLKCLPETLTVLKIRTKTFDMLQGTKLPFSLTHLEAQLHSSDIDWCKLLPENLLFCSVEIIHNLFGTELAYDQIPRSVQTLSLNFKYESCEPYIDALPPKLLHFTAWRTPPLSADALLRLPRTIQTLSGVFDSEIGPSIVAALPTSLTRLSCEIFPSSLPSLPKGLTDLTIAADLKQFLRTLPDSSLPTLLPPGLTFLRIPELDDMSARICPKRLKRLRITRGELSEENVKLLPEALQSLTTLNQQPLARNDLALRSLGRNMLSLHIMSLSEVVVNLSPDSSSWLPRSLTSLTLGDCIMPLGWFKSIPPSLDMLRLRVKEFSVEDMEDLCQACKCLTAFSLRLLIPTGSLTSFTIPVTRIGPLLESSPRSLRRLEILYSRYEAADPDLSNDQLKKLPPNLTSLTLPKTLKVTEDVSQYLPRTLYTVRNHHEKAPWFNRRPLYYSQCDVKKTY